MRFEWILITICGLLKGGNGNEPNYTVKGLAIDISLEIPPIQPPFHMKAINQTKFFI